MGKPHRVASLRVMINCDRGLFSKRWITDYGRCTVQRAPIDWRKSNSIGGRDVSGEHASNW